MKRDRSRVNSCSCALGLETVEIVSLTRTLQGIVLGLGIFQWGLSIYHVPSTMRKALHELVVLYSHL